MACVTPAGAAVNNSCQLKSAVGDIQHVIYLQFDNVHLRRDVSGVPSDLEQMPNLLNFLKNNGTVLNKHYTILISHTAGGILASLTGLNPDRMGITVSNSYDYYNGAIPTFTSGFKYWTAPVSATNALPNLVNGDSGSPKTTPAPWVSYTRAGCDVGNVSVTNTVLENNFITPGGDICNVYGCPSPEASETAALRTTDFVGIVVHCANTNTSICNNSTHAKNDPLLDEPGGYNGYSALFGAKYVNPAITNPPQPCVNDINGQQIKDTAGNCGFPGFDSMPASTTLGYVAQMQEAGIPVTFAYISDVHDNHAGGGAYGPGEQGYVDALKSYDDAFGKFLTRLANHGINASNTLFVVTSDENDHYAGQDPNAAPFSQKCDGVTKPCTYNTALGLANSGNPAHGIFDVTNGGAIPFVAPMTWPPATANGPLVGEMGYNLQWGGLLGSTIAGTGYDISFDSAPSFYINGQPQAVDSAGNIVLNATLRAFEKAAANLKAFDPYIDKTQLTPVAKYLVDAPTLKAIHMINADPRRTMSFTMFSQPDFFFQTSNPCMPFPNAANSSQGCLNDSFAWIHGDYSNDIGQTWLGLAGPGVKNGGIDDTTWTDHTDIVPTMMYLLGLSTDYQPDGRAITQVLTPSVDQSFTELGDVYKQLNAPYGDFAHSLIVASTNGIKADDGFYLKMEQKIQLITAWRDVLVQQMKNVLDGSADGNREQLIQQGRSLLASAQLLATIQTH